MTEKSVYRTNIEEVRVSVGYVGGMIAQLGYDWQAEFFQGAALELEMQIEESSNYNLKQLLCVPCASLF